jgi:hypothetical protein
LAETPKVDLADWHAAFKPHMRDNVERDDEGGDLRADA